jgi:uncharacterized membrane protein YdbT with pleckstrin-like domain
MAVMNPVTPEDERLQSVDNPLKVMQEGERVVCEIKRHPAGLWGLYMGAALLIILLVAGVALVPSLMPDATSSTKEALALGATIIAAIVLLYTYVARVVYQGNRWVVTSDSLTQITQVGLFRKMSSQLSLANLEDVSADQNGLIQSMIGFGTLKVETAGEHSKFTFPFCPRPNEYAKLIIGAHEAYIATNPGEMNTANQALSKTTSGYNQSYGPAQQPAQPVGDQWPNGPQGPTPPAQ